MTHEHGQSENPFRLEWKSPEERAKAESASRPARLERLRGDVEKLFPGAERAELRAEIERSFDVPQWGEYHNEGILMDTHFDAILEAFDGIEKGVFPEGIPEADRAKMQDVAARHHDDLRRYVYLHDISKPDLLRTERLPAEGQKKGDVWEGTLEQWYAEAGVPEDARRDPALLSEWLAKENLKGISYYNTGVELKAAGRKTEKTKHGEAGKEKLERLGETGAAPSILEAIARHEVAFQFEGVKPDTYKEYFESLSDDERTLALLASLTDTMGSWRKDGKPDLKNFRALLDSKRAYETLTDLEAKLGSAEGAKALDKKKVEAFLLALRKGKERIDESTDALLARIMKKCRPTEYDLDGLRGNLAELVQKGDLTQEEADKIHGFVASGDIASIGKTFGKKTRVIAPALKASEKA